MVEFLDCEMPDFMAPCCLVLVQWTFFISKQEKVHHRSRATTDRTSWDKPACIHDTLLRQHYIMISKKYLTNGHILLKYFELVFLQLHLVKISCKLITTRLSYKRNKKAPFYETPCIGKKRGHLVLRLVTSVMLTTSTPNLAQITLFHF